MLHPAVERVRKLFRLAESPNENEAESARQAARALMERHGLTDDDVSEDVAVAVDASAGHHAESLAMLASSVHGCSIYRRQGQVLIRGAGNCVRRAVALHASFLVSYQASINYLDRIVAPWFKPQCEAVWSVFWLTNFASSVIERHPQARQLVGNGAVAEMQRRAREISYNIDIRWLAQEAEKSGRSNGMQVSLRLDESEFALPERSATW